MIDPLELAQHLPLPGPRPGPLRLGGVDVDHVDELDALVDLARVKGLAFDSDLARVKGLADDFDRRRRQQREAFFLFFREAGYQGRSGPPLPLLLLKLLLGRVLLTPAH